MSFNSIGVFGGGVQESLEDLIVRKMAQAKQRAEIDNMQGQRALQARGQDVTMRGQDFDREGAQATNALGRDRLTLDGTKHGEEVRQFNAQAPNREASAGYLRAQTGETLRKPQAEKDERAYNTTRDQTQHGYRLGEIGAQGRNALAVANVRHPDSGTAAQQTAAQKEQNEVEDSLALINEIRNDKALSTATGPVDARGLGMVRDLEGVTRVKALHDNLVNKLSLAQSGKLKGQGPVSNFERDMLQKAATALTLKLGDPDYLNELGKVEQQFQRLLTGPRVVNAPDRGNLQTGGAVSQEYDFVPGKGLVLRGGGK